MFWGHITVIWVLVLYGCFSFHVYLHLLLHHDRDLGGDSWGLDSDKVFHRVGDTGNFGIDPIPSKDRAKVIDTDTDTFYL